MPRDLMKEWESFLCPFFDVERGFRLRHVRFLMKVEQREMAERLGVSQPMLSRIELGKALQVPLTLERLRKVLKKDYFMYVMSGQPFRLFESDANLPVKKKDESAPALQKQEPMIDISHFRVSKKEREIIERNLRNKELIESLYPGRSRRKL